MRDIVELASIDDACQRAATADARQVFQGMRDRLVSSMSSDGEILGKYERIRSRLTNPVVCIGDDCHHNPGSPSEAVFCPECRSVLPTADVCKLRSMDELVLCQSCSRILYSDSFHVCEWIPDTTMIDQDFLLLPDNVELGDDPVVVDQRDAMLPIALEGNRLCGTSTALRAMRLVPGQRVRLRALSATKQEYALVPSIVELTKESTTSAAPGRSLLGGIATTPSRDVREPLAVSADESLIHRITLDEESLSAGQLRIPPALAAILGPSGTIQAVLQPIGQSEVLWIASERQICNLRQWFLAAALESADIVCVRRTEGDPPLVIWTEWRRRIDKLLRLNPGDLIWRELCIRDCLLLVFYVLQRPAHYRELYAEISRHRELEISSVEATLSRHRGVLFDLVSPCTWTLLQEPGREPSPRRSDPKPALGVIEDDAVNRAAIAEILEQDMVYRLLHATARPMPYSEICRQLASILGVAAEALSATSFIDADDRRLTRVDTGEWALAEWFFGGDEVQDVSCPADEESAGGRPDSEACPKTLADRVLAWFRRRLAALREIAIRLSGSKGR